jgi:hypothetical protein
MTMKKLLPAIAIAALAFSGSALAQGALGGPSNSDSTNIQDEANSEIPYAPRDAKTAVPVVSGQSATMAPNPAPGFLSDRTYSRRTSVITTPRGLTKLKGPVLDANGNLVYASEEVGSANFR